MVVGIRHAALLSISMLVALTLGGTQRAHAQEILLTGPLAGAPVGRKPWRANRLELGAFPGISLGSNDDPAVLWGAEVLYYPTDRFGTGLLLSGASPLERSGETTLRGFVSPELVAVPWAGNANPFAHAYFRYDVHVSAGLARVFAERAGSPEAAWATWAGTGVRVWSASFFSNSLDYRFVASDPVRHFVTLSFSWWPIERRWDDE